MFGSSFRLDHGSGDNLTTRSPKTLGFAFITLRPSFPSKCLSGSTERSSPLDSIASPIAYVVRNCVAVDNSVTAEI